MPPMNLVSLTTAALFAVLPAQSPDSRADSRVCERAIDRVPGAAEELAQALGQAPASSGRAAFLRGCQHWAGGKDGPAAAEFEKAARADAANAVYRFWLGRVYGSQAQGANPLRQPGLARRTKDNFERAVALDSDYVDPRDGLVQYYLQAPGFLGGSVDKAKQQAAEIVRRNPYRGGFVNANIARHVKDTAGVIRAYESLMSQFPDSSAPYLQYVSVLQAAKSWDRAWDVLDRLAKIKPDDPIARYTYGRVAAESGQRPEAGERALLDYLAHAPRANEPSHAAAHWRMGMIREKQADRDGARAHYRTSLELDPKFQAAKDALARLK